MNDIKNIVNNKYKVGYTTGVFDLFHVGHLNLLKRAKEICEYLIVGVSIDDLVYEYKKKKPVIPYQERLSIVESIRYVDKVVPQIDRDKVAAYERLKFNVMILGDDWKGDKLFLEAEQELGNRGVSVVYLSYTNNVSSTLLKSVIEKIGN